MTRCTATYRSSMVLMLMIVTTVCCADSVERDDLQKQLAELKTAFDKGLIPEDLYREKIRVLLELSTTGAPKPPGLPTPARGTGGSQPVGSGTLAANLTGIWHVKSSDLGVFAPPYGLDKEMGLVTWKLMLSGSDLIVLEYSSGSSNAWTVVDPDPERFPYQKMKVSGARIDPAGKWINFRIDRGHGADEAYEAFELNEISKDEIRGVYQIHNLGPTGTGGQYSGSIRLVRYD